jgi:heat shock protein HslJ
MIAPMRIQLLVLAVAGLLAVGGCGSDDDGATATAGAGTVPTVADLDGRSFLSTAVRGRELVGGTQVTIRFEDGTLGVSAGCNSLGGAYAIEDGTLRWASAPAMTMIGCEDALQRQDDWLLAFLSDGATITAPDARTLSLAHDGVTIELAEGASAEQPPPIAGTAWRLTSIGDRGGDASSSVPAGVPAPTLRIVGGHAEVFAGCNSGSARVQLRDDGFARFGPLTLTRKACGRAAMEVERTVVSILSGRVALGFEGSQLSAAKDGRRLLFGAG